MPEIGNYKEAREMRIEDLARRISSHLAKGEPTIINLTSIDEEHLLLEKFAKKYGNSAVIHILNLELDSGEILDQMVKSSLLEKDPADDPEDLTSYYPIETLFGDASPVLIDQIGKQNYFISGFSAFAKTTDSFSGEFMNQADKDKFSIALGVRQAMRTGRAFSFIFSDRVSAADYYQRNLILQRMLDELLPPPANTELISS